MQLQLLQKYGHQFWQQVDTWKQYLLAYVKPHMDDPLFMQAQDEPTYLRYRFQRKNIRHFFNQMYSYSVALHRRGIWIAPHVLYDSLVAQCSKFICGEVSPVYYSRHLKRLAQRLPYYAFVFDGVAKNFQQYLQQHSQLAAHYFYHDAIQHLIQRSEAIALTEEIAVDAPWSSVRTYYAGLVSDELLQQVDAILSGQHDNRLDNQIHVNKALQQINSLFKPILAEITAPNQNSTPTHAAFNFQDAMTQSWKALKTEPYKIFSQAIGVTVGAQILYWLSSSLLNKNNLNLDHSLISQSFLNSPSCILPNAVTPLSIMGAMIATHAYKPSTFTTLPIWLELFHHVDMAVSQPIPQSFSKTLGGSGNDVGHEVQPTPDGGYIVVGTSSSFGAGDLDILLAKLTANGTLMWLKTFGGTEGDVGYSVQVTADNGYIVTGVYTNTTSSSADDLIVAKFTENGALIWAKTLGSTYTDVGTSIQKTLDNYYIVTGSRTVTPGDTDILVSKWADNGTLIWAKTLAGQNNYHDQALSVKVTSSGNYVVTGFVRGFGSSNSDVLLSLWSPDGTLLWAKRLDGGEGGDDEGSAVQLTSDNGYIVVGYIYTYSGASTDALITRWDENGTLLWASTFAGTNRNGEIGKSVALMPDNSAVMLGEDRSSELLLILHWAANGSLVLAKTVDGPASDVGNFIQRTWDNSYLVTGSSNSFNPTNQLWLIKLDSSTNLDGDGCSVQSNLLNVTSISRNLTAVSLNLTANVFNLQPSDFIIAIQTITNASIDTQCFSNGVLTGASVTTSVVTSGANIATTYSATTGNNLFTSGAELLSSNNRDGVPPYVWVVVGVGGVLILAVTSGGIFYCVKHKQKRALSTKLTELSDISSVPPEIAENDIDTSSTKVLYKFGYTHVFLTMWNKRVVVVKEIAKENPKEIEKEYATELFRKELKMMREVSKKKADVRSKYVIELLGFNTSKNWLVTEYFPKGSLADNLSTDFKDADHIGEDNLQFTPQQRTRIFMNVAKGLSFLHKNEVIHRDLKPANILLDDDCNPKLCDFGISTQSSKTQITSHWQGTQGWAAPEMNKHIYHAKSDVFSYAILLIALVKSQGQPYEDDDYASYNKFIKTPQDSSIDQFVSVPAVNENYKNLIVDCGQYDFHKRPTTEQIVEKIKTIRIEWNDLKHLVLFANKNKKSNTKNLQSIPEQKQEQEKVQAIDSPTF